LIVSDTSTSQETGKIVSKITYDMSSGMLNRTQLSSS